ncbi:hypothetical protein MMU07_17530 [Aquiflexum sp. LQ15W]|uniref:hypothetical protein n=1 Tax=Cognataquiflexum nitidum TaxID=2922272 RepID=UPI001F133778|nr:hypothetical protein [Cognataquiflexum nitidum]MCH6201387.1 hypothetical protein [Cognataquiflexum nitidum]
MEQLEDITAKDWLTNHINWKNATRPFTLGNFLPNKFDNYISILWTPGVIDNFPFDKINQPPDSIEQTNANVEVWRQFKIFLNEKNYEAYRPTTFAELSNFFNQPYDRGIINTLPWKTQGIATLYKQTRQRFEKIVNVLTDGTELNIYIEDSWRWASVYNLLPSAEDVAYKISSVEFFDLMDITFYDANLYLYPVTNSWCLINMEDLGYNILAYNNSFADKLNQLNLSDTFAMSYDDIIFK